MFILEYINSNAFLRDRLVLKGGTALNLTVFNLPRLSVVLDFDFHSYDDRETVLEERVKAKELLQQFVSGNYKPELLFSGKILENIKNHPMAIWKTMNR